MSVYYDGTERIEWGTCALCGVKIMHEGEWDARHSSDDEDYHDECCMTIGPCSKSQPDLGWAFDKKEVQQ